MFAPTCTSVDYRPRAPATPSSAPTATTTIYRAGTLSYTRGALVTMLFWMLWADLALQLMELLQTIVPIQLQRIGASETLIGIIRDSMQAALTLLILPVIGAKSDNHRGPRGRRRPFLLWSILPVSAFLIALGYAEPITLTLHGVLTPVLGGITVKTVGIVMITLFVAGFFFFNNYTLPVYQYLIADVVPKEIMGKFIGLYRAIGAIAGFMFNKLLFPHVDTHIEWIYISCTLFYAFAFLLLVWRVKEGEYPPPSGERKPGPVTFIKRYYRLCFTTPFYWKIYITSLLYWSAMVPFYSFGMLYFKVAPKGATMTSLNMFPSELGDIRAWTFLPQLVVFPIIGFLIDKFHSLRFLTIGFASMASCFIIGVVLAFGQPHITPTKSPTDKTLVTECASKLDQHGKPERIERVIAVKDIAKTGEAKLLEVPSDAPAGTRKFLEDKYYNHAPAWSFWWYLSMMIILAVIQLSYLAMQPALFPSDTYGQFFSANQWIFSIGLLVAPVACGALLEVLADYRFIFVWSAGFFTLAAVMSIVLFRHWQRLGGKEHYAPPESAGVRTATATHS